MMKQNDINKIAKHLGEIKYGHLERRLCTADSPMPMEDKDKFRWSHPDAEKISDFFNLIACKCPHCNLTFTCLPPEKT